MKACLLFVLITCLTACYSHERNCADFRTGTFISKTYLSGEMVETKFVRNDTLEVDYFQGKVDSSSVRWINDCEYILKNLDPGNRLEKKPIHIKILTTDKNSYTFEFSEVGSAKKFTGSASRISNPE